jgi:hypothetical protein
LFWDLGFGVRTSKFFVKCFGKIMVKPERKILWAAMLLLLLFLGVGFRFRVANLTLKTHCRKGTATRGGMEKTDLTCHKSDEKLSYLLINYS